MSIRGKLRKVTPHFLYSPEHNIICYNRFSMHKIAVVTGASYGLGEAISLKLLALGYKVYGISRSPLKVQHANFIWVKADLLKDSELRAVATNISEPKIDVLINNVGTAFTKKAREYTDIDFETTFSLNFKVHAKITQLLFKRLQGSTIINVSSLSDRYPDPGYALYGASKTALNLFFETMAAEEPQVKILNILPSYVDTPLQHIVNDGTDFNWDLCMQPEGIAKAVEYVLSHSNQFETGSRVIIEKTVTKGEPYTPEKLWAYSTTDNAITKIR